MTDIVDRLRALEAWIRKPTGEPYNMNMDMFDDAADEITRLRAENERLLKENFSLSAWQCEFADGKTGLVAHEHGGTYCAMAKENERLRAALEEIAAAKPQQIGDTGFQQGPLSLWMWAKRTARAALDGQPRAGEGGVMEYSIELWQDGQKVAAVHSDSASNALWAIAGYAAQYEQDGPVTVRVKNKNKNKKRKTAND